MKKILFVLALIAVYGISFSVVKANVIPSEKGKVTVVASDNNPVVSKSDPKKTDVKKEQATTGKKVETKCEGKKEGKGCCSKMNGEGCDHAKCCGSQKEPAPASDKK